MDYNICFYITAFIKLPLIIHQKESFMITVTQVLPCKGGREWRKGGRGLGVGEVGKQEGQREKIETMYWVNKENFNNN